MAAMICKWAADLPCAILTLHAPNTHAPCQLQCKPLPPRHSATLPTGCPTYMWRLWLVPAPPTQCAMGGSHQSSVRTGLTSKRSWWEQSIPSSVCRTGASAGQVSWPAAVALGWHAEAFPSFLGVECVCVGVRVSGEVRGGETGDSIYMDAQLRLQEGYSCHGTWYPSQKLPSHGCPTDPAGLDRADIVGRPGGTCDVRCAGNLDGAADTCGGAGAVAPIYVYPSQQLACIDIAGVPGWETPSMECQLDCGAATGFWNAAESQHHMIGPMSGVVGAGFLMHHRPDGCFCSHQRSCMRACTPARL